MTLARFKNPVFRLFTLAVILVVFFCKTLGAQPFIPKRGSMQVHAVQELAFGSFVTGSTGGTVVVSPEGNRSVTGTVIGLALSPVSSAVFEVEIAGRHWIHFNFPESAQLTRTGGSESMTITNFTSDKPENRFRTDPGPPKTYPVKVGATLNVQNSTINPQGDYTGTFTVTVTFIRE